MASSQLAMVNGALELLGDTPLQSMVENRLSAEVAVRVYDMALDMALSRGPWRFAMLKGTLSQMLTAPLNEWGYSYQIPPECRRMVRVYPDQPFEIYGDKIYTHASALDADYVARSTDLENIIPAHFAKYMAHELAVFMAPGLTGSDAKQGKAEEWRGVVLAQSLAIDAQQRPNIQFRHAPFVNARLG